MNWKAPPMYGSPVQQPQMMMTPGVQPQQRGMGGGVMTGVAAGAAGLAAGGLAGYALGGGFSSSPTEEPEEVQTTEFSESVDFGGDDWME